MPDPGEDYQRWSTVADNNGDIDPLIDWHEGQARRTVNNSSRSEMAAHAKNRNLLNGSIITTGLPNAQAFLSGVNYLTVPTGLRVMLKVGSGLDNDGLVTLDMDGIGAVAVKKPDLTNTTGGEFKTDRYVELVYNGTFWIYLYSAGNFAPADDPVFEGDPQAPTPPPEDNDNSIATTEWVRNLIFGGQGIVIGLQVFSTAGTATYTPTSGMKSCIVECIGGGGGGGGANSGGGTDGWFVGGGGGSGGYSRKFLTGAVIGASQPITVGAGGTVGGGGYPDPGVGGAGGATIFGATSAPLCKANGGIGGHGASQAAAGLAGMGGSGGTTSGAIGDIIAQGAPGHTGFYHGFEQSPGAAIGISSSAGGSSAIGGGGTSHSQLGGISGGNYGSGGSGGGAVTGTGSNAGGPGSAGVIIITEFSGSGAVGPAGPAGPTGPQGPIGPTGPSGPGTGDVLHSGTPTNGQLAQWTDASHIEGVAASSLGFAPLASPVLTGNPQAPTPAPGDNDTSIATTAWVTTAIAAIPSTSPSISEFTTGDWKFTHKTVADTGWIMWVDGTIGNASSGSSVFADVAAQALFTLYYQSYTDALCPLLTSGGAATTRAAQGTAAAAWAANCRMTLPKGSGRVAGIAGTGAGLTARVAGATDGTETHTIANVNLPNVAVWSGQVTAETTGASGSPGNIGLVNRLSDIGGGGSSAIAHVPPSTFGNVMIKL